MTNETYNNGDIVFYFTFSSPNQFLNNFKTDNFDIPIQNGQIKTVSVENGKINITFRNNTEHSFSENTISHDYFTLHDYIYKSTIKFCKEQICKPEANKKYWTEMHNAIVNYQERLRKIKKDCENIRKQHEEEIKKPITKETTKGWWEVFDRNKIKDPNFHTAFNKINEFFGITENEWDRQQYAVLKAFVKKPDYEERFARMIRTAEYIKTNFRQFMQSMGMQIH